MKTLKLNDLRYFSELPNEHAELVAVRSFSGICWLFIFVISRYVHSLTEFVLGYGRHVMFVSANTFHFDSVFNFSGNEGEEEREI
jgi:hypothetical protein